MNKNDIKYPINFHQVLDEIFQTKGWYQGNNFKDGVFIKLNYDCTIHVYEFRENHFGEKDLYHLAINDGIYNQHYRRVYTQPDIMRMV